MNFIRFILGFMNIASVIGLFAVVFAALVLALGLHPLLGFLVGGFVTIAVVSTTTTKK